MELALIKYLNKLTDVIKKFCWDSVSLKGQEIHAIGMPLYVQSYALLPLSSSFNSTMKWLPETIDIEKFFRTGDYFEAWVPRDDAYVIYIFLCLQPIQN